MGLAVAPSGRSVLECASLDAADRFDAWTEAVNSSFVPLLAQSAADLPSIGFDGRLVSQTLGMSAVSSVAGSAVRVRRTSKLIAQTDPGYIKLGLQLRGMSVITQDGRDTALAPGDFALYDTTRPYALDFDSTFKMFVLMFPIEAIRLDRPRLGALTASRFSGRHGLGGITSKLLMAISDGLDQNDLSAEVPLTDAVFDLLGAAIAERLDDALPPDERSERRAMLAKIETYIAMHLGDADLTVQSVADARHVSIRYLQELFADREETVSGWIRRRRLEQSRRDLADPILARNQIATVGARWGFADATAFARAFRQEFGVTPSDYGQSRRAGTANRGAEQTDSQSQPIRRANR